MAVHLDIIKPIFQTLSLIDLFFFKFFRQMSHPALKFSMRKVYFTINSTVMWYSFSL